MATSRVERTLKRLKDDGILYDRTEHYVKRLGTPFGFRRDLFNIIDVLCIDASRGFVGIQCCGSDYASHFRKITIDNREKSLAWLRARGILEIWAWRKLKVKRGGKAMQWNVKITEITLNDFNVRRRIGIWGNEEHHYHQ